MMPGIIAPSESLLYSKSFATEIFIYVDDSSDNNLENLVLWCGLMIKLSES